MKQNYRKLSLLEIYKALLDAKWEKEKEIKQLKKEYAEIVSEIASVSSEINESYNVL
jgi:cobyric acid synthase